YKFTLSLSCLRCTTKSKKPCSNKNSEVWKPSGKSFPVVSFTMRGPAKPINAPGSAILISPNIAYEAVVPPVVDRYIKICKEFLHRLIELILLMFLPFALMKKQLPSYAHLLI